jgi:hypothetical protein
MSEKDLLMLGSVPLETPEEVFQVSFFRTVPKALFPATQRRHRNLFRSVLTLSRPATAAPRSSAACRQTAAASDGSPPAAASSNVRA